MTAAQGVLADANVAELRKAAPGLPRLRALGAGDPGRPLGRQRPGTAGAGRRAAGRREDRQGVPFVGPAGKLLQQIVGLGSTAAKALLGSAFRVTQSRGQVLEHETPIGLRRVLAPVHPSSILRTDEAERDAAYAGLVADLRVAGQAVASYSVVSPRSLGVWRCPGTHLAAFSSVAMRLGIPPSSALRCTHLDDARRQGTSTTRP